jgi:Zn-dependent M32 family carboxypeptidase
VLTEQTDKAIAGLLEKLKGKEASLSEFQAANVRIASERFERNARMSSELASRAAELESR